MAEKNTPKQNALKPSVLLDETRGRSIYVEIGELSKTDLSVVTIVREEDTGRHLLAKSIIQPESEVRTRFLEAAVQHGKLQHDNIVQTVDYQNPKDGDPVFITEFLEGVTLAQLIEDVGTLEDDEEITTFLSQICNALEYAHELGVVHGGLKPSNIILTQPEDEVVVKVADFGFINSSRELPEHLEKGLTPYMSPEQKSGEPTEKSDVFSVAAIAYQIITGYMPYLKVEDGVTDESASEIVSVTEYRPDIPESERLGAALERALQIDPNMRTPTIMQFSQELQEWLLSIGDYEEESDELEAEEAPQSEDSGEYTYDDPSGEYVADEESLESYEQEVGDEQAIEETYEEGFEQQEEYSEEQEGEQYEAESYQQSGEEYTTGQDYDQETYSDEAYDQQTEEYVEQETEQYDQEAYDQQQTEETEEPSEQYSETELAVEPVEAPTEAPVDEEVAEQSVEQAEEELVETPVDYGDEEVAEAPVEQVQEDTQSEPVAETAEGEPRAEEDDASYYQQVLDFSEVPVEDQDQSVAETTQEESPPTQAPEPVAEEEVSAIGLIKKPDEQKKSAEDDLDDLDDLDVLDDREEQAPAAAKSATPVETATPAPAKPRATGFGADIGDDEFAIDDELDERDDLDNFELEAPQAVPFVGWEHTPTSTPTTTGAVAPETVQGEAQEMSGRFSKAQRLQAISAPPGMETFTQASIPGRIPAPDVAPQAGEAAEVAAPQRRKIKKKAKLTKRRKPAIKKTMTKLMALRSTQVEQEETVVAKFTEKFGADGVRQSPKKIIFRFVATVTILSVSSYLLVTNLDTVKSLWFVASTQLSSLMGRKPAPEDEIPIQTEITEDGAPAPKNGKQKGADGQSVATGGPGATTSGATGVARQRQLETNIIQVHHYVDRRMVVKTMPPPGSRKYDGIVYPYLFTEEQLARDPKAPRKTDSELKVIEENK